ncbi:small, acid-soluble spore protein, alpha/beta type [Tumebacillus permanentifrigoris]|uniref:Small acid-soluble spore protein alpha/beta type n=1 Tax=Tumebacillus permanentifrigoris TaxID=378543 RepID=A0A316D885_9BACL|nr:small, acid-soluble spore protein, alpha/beta type [Tumebacillus permanentifrigoris]PWK12787.1 small acid-soluble spore protein alpha/beta type [Tumebacillus permanentifrigoris]
MSKPKIPFVRGAQAAREVFRTEVAREIGLDLGPDRARAKPLPIHPVDGAMVKRMIELADRHSK